MKKFDKWLYCLIALVVIGGLGYAARTDLLTIQGSASLRNVDVFTIDSDGDLTLYQGDINLGQSGSAPSSATANTYPCLTVPMTNNYGASVSANSLVLVSTAGGITMAALNSTTTVFGVAYETIAAGAVGDVCIEGLAVVQTTGTVTAGDTVISTASTNVGYATGDATPTTGADLGIFIENASGDDTALILIR